MNVAAPQWPFISAGGTTGGYVCSGGENDGVFAGPRAGKAERLGCGLPAAPPAIDASGQKVQRKAGFSTPTCVPVGQAHELFRALSGLGAEAVMATYPGEGHQLAQADHIADYWARTLRWSGAHVPI